MQYQIAESFLSFQGEGIHLGRRAYFVRLFGCNVKCPWCDSKEAWLGEPKIKLTAEEILAEVLKSSTEIVVITGGEPCLYDLRPLLTLLGKHNIATHLETSGTLEIKEDLQAKFSWVALSPKPFMPAKESALARADELKFIISSEDDFAFCLDIATKATNASALWLHPEWTKAQDYQLLSKIADFVSKNGGRWRCGYQVHKNYHAR